MTPPVPPLVPLSSFPRLYSFCTFAFWCNICDRIQCKSVPIHQPEGEQYLTIHNQSQGCFDSSSLSPQPSSPIHCFFCIYCFLDVLLLNLRKKKRYSVSMDDLKNFRQLNSVTPGHPENFVTAGVEVNKIWISLSIRIRAHFTVVMEPADKKKSSSFDFRPQSHRPQHRTGRWGDGGINTGYTTRGCFMKYTIMGVLYGV